MGTRRRILAVLLLAALSLGLLVAWALEGGEVVVLHTRAMDGTTHSTRIWIADAEGAAWIEAATPERAWYRDLADQRRVELSRGGERLCVIATPVPGRAGHRRIRELLAAKYGWRDDFVAWLQDTSGSVAVRLEPCAQAS